MIREIVLLSPWRFSQYKGAEQMIEMNPAISNGAMMPLALFTPAITMTTAAQMSIALLADEIVFCSFTMMRTGNQAATC